MKASTVTRAIKTLITYRIDVDVSFGEGSDLQSIIMSHVSERLQILDGVSGVSWYSLVSGSVWRLTVYVEGDKFTHDLYRKIIEIVESAEASETVVFYVVANGPTDFAHRSYILGEAMRDSDGNPIRFSSWETADAFLRSAPVADRAWFPYGTQIVGCFDSLSGLPNRNPKGSS